eukprot:jgi/Mesen1/7455/ME000389S06798
MELFHRGRHLALAMVIGPYRSGKSFLLNQLLSLSCNEGKRWSGFLPSSLSPPPVDLEINGVTTSVLFLDTEGFESIGKSTVYDDRIFALAAILSSVLIYNLPETVKEADIAKLSFAVELAEEFYGRQDLAAPLLSQTPGPTPESRTSSPILDTGTVNQIRQSLALMAENSTAFGLRQPHLARTKLCELADRDFDQAYVEQREQLKGVVSSMVSPKMVQGRAINGPEFASLLEKTLEALNKGKIPTAGSVVDFFNRGVVTRCLELYTRQVARQRLPVPEGELAALHGAAAKAAAEMFERERFGRKSTDEALAPLQLELATMWARERAQFLKDYNQRLFNWLVVFSLVVVVLARFVLKWVLLEFAAWALFVFLETYTRIFWSFEGLYYNAVWRAFIAVWEAVVFNPLLDMDKWSIPLAWCALVSLVLCRCYRVRRRPLLPVTSPTRTSSGGGGAFSFGRLGRKVAHAKE